MKGLSKRDKLTLAAGGLALAALALVQFAWLPALDRQDRLARALAAEKASYEQICRLEKEYQGLAGSAGPSAAVRLEKGFSLFSFLDRQAARAGIKGNVDYMKPHAKQMDTATLSIVKLRLKQIVLRDFIRFVRAVEASDQGITIAALNLAASGKTKDRLDATMEVQVLMAGDET